MPPRTQTDRWLPAGIGACCRFFTGPLGLAVIVTLANAVKPVLVDDTAYLLHARHLAQHPLDPYGFDSFWYTAPEPAMDVLLPPVLPYWLALGIRLFGEQPAILKLWLFPFVWLFARAVWELLHRFARGTERAALPLIVLSPAVLPMVNLMLDIPAAALGLTAMVLFVGAVRKSSRHTPCAVAAALPRQPRHTECACYFVRLAVAAGLLTALAMQTKYTALLVPAVMLWCGYSYRRMRLAALAVGVAVVAFAGWELLLLAKYGQSHFLHHLVAQQAGDGLRMRLHDKAMLVAPLTGHLGCLAVGIGLYAGRAIGFSRRVLLIAALLWIVGGALIAVLPYQDTILLSGKEPRHEKLALAAAVWRTTGTAVLLTAPAWAVMLLIRVGRAIAMGRRADTLFVAGWVLLEVAGYFALTPFPAARRLVGLTVALGILAARVVSRVSRAKHERRPPGWVVPFGVAVGVLIAALDTLDAFPEKALAERAARTVEARNPTGTVWYVGHWGFQYYCERAGMKPMIPGRSRLEVGDYLVLPLYPDDVGFWRPYAGSVPVRPPADAVELVEELVWDDPLSAQTIPNFYGGTDPVVGRDHPRLRVGVYRIVRRPSPPVATGGL